MRIGLNDIDPTIANALSARVAEDCYPVEKYLHDGIDWERKGKKGKRPPTTDEERAYREHKKREERHSGWSAATMFLPLMSGGVVYFQQGLLPGLAAWLAPTLVGAWMMKRTAAKTALEREIIPVELRAVVPVLDLSPAEKLYCAAVLHLMEAPRHVQESTGREILGNMNELLIRHREIETQLEQVRLASESNPLQPLEEERARIEERLNGATDAIERASVEQTLRLCEARLDHARALHSAPRRLEAQREAIHQALASIPIALVRQTTSAGTSQEHDVAAVTETISQIAQYARAEEEAVAEVLALRNS